MSDPIEHRVTRLELRVDNHDEDLTEIKEESKTMNAALKAIQANLNQIKWLAVGATTAFLAKSNNLLEILFNVLK
jgi:predicted  nucleic acid-binding Zn-ribbon protein